MKHWIYCKSLMIVLMILFSGLNFIPNTSSICNNLDNFHINKQETFLNTTEIIEQYTWSILRYGLRSNMPFSTNFGNIYYARPSPGTSLIPAAMMSKFTCFTALSIFSENKKDTFYNLEDFDIKNMIHTRTAFLPDISEWNTLNIKAFRRETIDEMNILGDICLLGELVGNCYAQSSFNTAILRLCGFGPEEVFNIGVQDHTVNIVLVDDKWYVLDSTKALAVRLGHADGLISEFYNPHDMKMINFLENDKYFISFGTKYPDNYQNQDPYLFNLFSNMEEETLLRILDGIIPLFNNSKLGIPEIEPLDFINKSVPCTEMKNVSVPYTINDAIGSTIDEKAKYLSALTRSFIFNQTGESIPNQYDRSLYVIGLLSVDYPQAYANAAKYAALTSYFGNKFDSFGPILDLLITTFWVRLITKNLQIMPKGCVAFSDLLYLRHAGSSTDQAVMAYGTLRNMKKDSKLWDPADLYVLITKDYNGYLAVNVSNSWKYVNFGIGKVISSKAPENIMIVFNEKDNIEFNNNQEFLDFKIVKK